MLKSITTILLLSFVLFSCQTDTIELGNIEGKVVSPSGKAIPGAKIQTSDGDYATSSNVKGEFSLQLPIGQSQLKIFTGSGNVFSSSKVVDVEAEQTTNVDEITLDNITKLGYVWGDYDNVQDIIEDSLGYDVDSISIKDLTNPSLLEQYSVIFLNCGEFPLAVKYNNNLPQDFGLTAIEVNEILQNVNDYVSNGGNIYASDWSITYIGNMCNTADSLDNVIYSDNEFCFDDSGGVSSITATVSDLELQQLIGNTADIEFDLPDWAVLEMDDDFGRTLLSFENTILCFAKTYGDGNMIYTSFHNEANITEDMQLILEWIALNY